MGRRAKNKQGAPEPLADPDSKKSSVKKLGKRKAEPEDEERPGKKIKEDKKAAVKEGTKRKVTFADQKKPEGKKGKGANEIVKKNKEVDGSEDERSSDGWEDVDEDGDLTAEAKVLFNDSDGKGEDEWNQFNMEGEEDDDPLRGPIEELDLGSDDEDESDGEVLVGKLRSRRSKQQERPEKIIPTVSDDSDEDSGDESDGPITMTNMEARSHALDARAAREAELDMEEMQRAAEGDGEDDLDVDMESIDGEGFVLPTVEEREEQKKAGGPDVNLVQRRMRQCVRVLGNFKKLNRGRARTEYVDQLVSDIASYYGYNEFLTEKLFNLFPVAEAIEFFEANEVPRPVTIRTNTLRTRRRDLAQALINRGVNLEPIGKWTNVGLQVFESTVPIGATPEYLAGHYMLQAASSFLPVIALSPQPNERVLDMASAPGGKTTHMAALMQNTGVVFANDANKARTKSLTANVHRLGCKNVVVCSYDGREFPKVIGGFDRILLDAPCSGTGVISKDASVKVNKASHTALLCSLSLADCTIFQSERDFMLLSHLQKQLILCAIDSVNPSSKTGGYLVYSTCSVTVDENEAVVDYALKKRSNVKLVEAGLEFGRPGFTSYRGKTFHQSVSMTRRFYPHVHNMDGFFVAKFKVEKPVKTKKADEEETTDITAEAIEQDAGFDSEEDKQYIERGYRMKWSNRPR
ncbi:NOL1/NOP2/sun family putative RNA met [Neolentinus lepideus HHB14362 ss-1]|uniref:Nucleolar protein 2 n=1 Tax=Neolentinus lepideus HHB14362 ss-1 TaxID=1314782 RepID=A0A165T8A9_9AGAM|nr:NOL1/NOP2/sun family putative RNA met [Neolentinus lepideus HHB14362 ss-1]